MHRRDLLHLINLSLTTPTALLTNITTEGQPMPTTDRNGSPLSTGMLVHIPCLITSIVPSLNPALTSVTVRTLPNITQGADYDDGLALTVYSNHLLKP